MTGSTYDENSARRAAGSEAATAPAQKANSEIMKEQNAQLKAYYLLILSNDSDPSKISADFTVVPEIMKRRGWNREKLFDFLKEFAYLNRLDWEKIRIAIERQMEIRERTQAIEEKLG